MSTAAKILSTIRQHWVSVGATTTATTAVAFYAYSYTASQKRTEEDATALEMEMERQKEEEALMNIDKPSPSFSIFQDGPELLKLLISGKDPTSMNTGTSSPSSAFTRTRSTSSTSGDEEDRRKDEDESVLFPSLKNIIQQAVSVSQSNEDQTHEGEDDNTNTGADTDSDTSPTPSPITSMAKSFASLITGEISESEFNDMIHHAQNISQKGDVDETRSTIELINLFLSTQEEVKLHIASSLGSFLDLRGFDPTSIFYYLENEDAVKNPSWKRRKHRYCKGVDATVVKDLNCALHLAETSYYNSEEKIKKRLKDRTIMNDEWEVIYCQVDSLPEKPSHFLAIKKGQSRWSSQLEVLVSVSGTNSVPDLLTDALLDDADYRGGKAHAGILRSGRYLVNKHKELLLSLLEKSNKKQVKLTLVGHSLGAGK